MIRILGLIPARGGSKALPRKNILPLCGKSLIQRAWESARDSYVLDRVILSTDDDEIAEQGRHLGLEVPFMRPAIYATDTSPMIDVAIHALKTLSEQEKYVCDALMILQPTSPLRTPQHIRSAADLLQDNDAVCSVLPLPQDLSPYYLMKIDEKGFLDFFMADGARFTRHQDLPIAYRREGTIFLIRCDVILGQRTFYGTRCKPMLMDPSEVLNIDTAEDWDDAVRLFQGRSL